MGKLWTLTKMDFSILTHSMSIGRSGSGKKQMAGLGLVGLLGLLMVYMSVVYSIAMGQLMAQYGVLDMMVPMMMLLAVVMELMFTLFAAQGLVFSGNDSDLMLALPVPAMAVVLGKVLALYLENLYMTVLWMLPVGIFYGLNGGPAGVGFWLRYLPCIVFMPLIPALLSLLGGWVLALTASRVKHRALVSNLISMLLMVAALVGAMQINRIAALILDKADQVRGLFHTWLLPAGLLGDAAGGSWLAVPAFAALCLLPFLAVVWLVSTQYKRILTGVASRSTRSDYRMGRVEASGQFAALYKKECGRYFGSTIYVMNTAVGVVMAVGGCAYIAFSSTGRMLLAQLGAGALPAVVAMVCVVQAMCCTTASSISLEGRTLWILKEAPIPARTLLGAKAALNLSLTVPSSILCTGLLASSMDLSAGEAAVVLLVFLAVVLWSALFGLVANLLLPKLDCPNDTIIVKQSAASMLGMFGSAAMVGVGALVYLVLGKLVGFLPFAVGAALALLAVCAGLWRWLDTKGTHILLHL